MKKFLDQLAKDIRDAWRFSVELKDGSSFLMSYMPSLSEDDTIVGIVAEGSILVAGTPTSVTDVWDDDNTTLAIRVAEIKTIRVIHA